MRGSRPGERRGGRTKGTPNRASVKKAEEVAASGLTPLDYMLSVMRDTTADLSRRDDMAKAAASYVHPKLAAVEHSGPNGGPIEVSKLTDADLAAIIAAGSGTGAAAPQKGPRKSR